VGVVGPLLKGTLLLTIIFLPLPTIIRLKFGLSPLDMFSWAIRLMIIPTLYAKIKFALTYCYRPLHRLTLIMPIYGVDHIDVSYLDLGLNFILRRFLPGISNLFLFTTPPPRTFLGLSKYARRTARTL